MHDNLMPERIGQTTRDTRIQMLETECAKLREQLRVAERERDDLRAENAALLERGQKASDALARPSTVAASVAPVFPTAFARRRMTREELRQASERIRPRGFREDYEELENPEERDALRQATSEAAEPGGQEVK